MRSIEWLAGLLEGEGCFTQKHNGSGTGYTTPNVEVAMTDRDVILAAKELFESVGGRTINTAVRSLPSGKECVHVRVSGLPAVRIMHAVLPFMGERRTQAIRSIIKEWKPVQYKAAVAFKRQLQGVA